MRRRAKREAATRASGTVLDNTKHEHHFAQSVATGTSATGAYTSVGYSEAGAASSASRLLTDANVSARIEELKTSIAEGVVEVDIRKRSARIQGLENNLNCMLGLIEARALEYSDDPGGATGMLVKDYLGKNAEQSRIDYRPVCYRCFTTRSQIAFRTVAITGGTATCGEQLLALRHR
jgi:anti-sigma28 factor (negative regulator of flagellin synthesis)